MRIDRIELILVRLPLVRTFRTSSSTKAHIDHILVRAEAGAIEGWGECASPSDPYYCPETTETCWHLLKDFLAPAVLGKEWNSIDEFVQLYSRVKGNGFAKSGLEMAAWDALGKSKGRSLFDLLGATNPRIESGVSLGIEDDVPTLLRMVDQYAGEGYKRIKLKIAPGWDVDVVREVRKHFPDIPLQVDANSAYTLADLDHLKRLDEFGLILIEQPLAHDDIIDHARLQAALSTPVCLDESIHSADDARKAIDLGACRVINIKVSRVGGPSEAKRVHDVCRSRQIPVWCGGMHEFGVGRAANLAVSGLPGFTLPGDISGSDKYYREDLVEPPLLATDGAMDVPRAPGLGVTPSRARIDRHALRTVSLTRDGESR
ncbi:MAG TPA: o-succinylbenzoate synthase [Isosphaeraceae bacterium]|jgi:O-succinylbenzoate synthase